MGRYPYGAKRKYHVQALWERHHRMIRLRLLGWGNIQIADALGVTPQNVSDVLNSDIAKNHLSVLTSAADVDTVNLRRRIEMQGPVSLDLLVAIRDGMHPDASLPLRASIAQDILDRIPESSKKIEQRTFLFPVTAEVIAEATKKANEAKKLAAAAGSLSRKAEEVAFEEVTEDGSKEDQC